MVVDFRFGEFHLAGLADGDGAGAGGGVRAVGFGGVVDDGFCARFGGRVGGSVSSFGFVLISFAAARLSAVGFSFALDGVVR